MTEDIKVSVLIPCYNVERYVDDALYCILSQSYHNLQIILIDDGSTDDTFDKLLKIANADKRIVLVKNEVNLGLIRTLNKGLDLVTGDYIERFDADDIINTNRIARQMEYIRTHTRTDLLTSHATYITPEGKFHSRSSSFYCTSTKSAKFLALFETPLLHAGMLIKTALLKEIRYSETAEAQHIEDYVLFSEILFRNLQIYVDTGREGAYFYRRNNLSVSGRNRPLQFENAVNRSVLNISTCLHYNVPLALLRIIKLSNPHSWNISLLNQSLMELKKLKQMYFMEENGLHEKERNEINTWVAQRRLRLIALALIKAPVATKFGAIGIFILNADVLFYSETYSGIFDKMVWIFNRLRYKN